MKLSNKVCLSGAAAVAAGLLFILFTDEARGKSCQVDGDGQAIIVNNDGSRPAVQPTGPIIVSEDNSICVVTDGIRPAYQVPVVK